MATVELVEVVSPEGGGWQYAPVLASGGTLPDPESPVYPTKAAVLRAAASAGYTHYQLMAHWGRIPKKFCPR